MAGLEKIVVKPKLLEDDLFLEVEHSRTACLKVPMMSF